MHNENDVYIGIGSNIVPEGYRDIHTALLDATTQLSNSVDVVTASPCMSLLLFAQTSQIF